MFGLESFQTVRHGKSQKSVEVSTGRYPILATGGQIGLTNTAPGTPNPSVSWIKKRLLDRLPISRQPVLDS